MKEPAVLRAVFGPLGVHAIVHAAGRASMVNLVGELKRQYIHRMAAGFADAATKLA
jgi:hypothetical protein